MKYLQSKRVLLAVCGSIAAYKSVFLLRLLQEQGAEVRVIMTESAQKFVTSLTFFTLSRHKVYTDLWSESGDWSEHVHLGLWADVMLIAPITANTLAKLANGNCDDVLSAVYLAAKCPVMIAPAMDRDMMSHPAVINNINLLTERGVKVIEPEEGYLASGLIGKGRLTEPTEIVSELIRFLGKKDWVGKKILITAGPTQESIDPVRYISNHSTGKMGIALAEIALNRGASVTLILGPTSLKPAHGLKTIQVKSAEEMFQAVEQNAEFQDVFILTAAVSDYRPVQYSDVKIKKNMADMSLELTKTKDILAYLGETKKDGQILIGFALETHDAERYAKQKLINKKADAIVMNSLQVAGAGFGFDTNQFTVFCADGTIKTFDLKLKSEIADELLTFIQEEYVY